MSDDSFADFRQADGRFTEGNRGGPGRPRARDRVTNAVLNGDVTPREGAAAARVIDAHRSMIVTVDLERRMKELEEEGARLRGEKP